MLVDLFGLAFILMHLMGRGLTAFEDAPPSLEEAPIKAPTDGKKLGEELRALFFLLSEGN